jgi:hypothetical protein
MSLVDSFLGKNKQKLILRENGRKNPLVRTWKSPAMKKEREEGWNQQIDSFFSQFFVNCMHPKVRVWFLRDKILS